MKIIFLNIIVWKHIIIKTLNKMFKVKDNIKNFKKVLDVS